MISRSDIVRCFIDAANRIKIYSEVLEAHKSNEYSKDLNNAKRIYFLGFGYHEQNLLALGLKDSVLSEDVQIFGTAYDMTDREVHGKKDRIAQSIGWKIRDYTGPASEVIDLANKWESTNDEKISLIKEFFRKHENADLV